MSLRKAQGRAQVERVGKTAPHAKHALATPVRKLSHEPTITRPALRIASIAAMLRPESSRRVACTAQTSHEPVLTGCREAHPLTPSARNTGSLPSDDAGSLSTTGDCIRQLAHLFLSREDPLKRSPALTSRNVDIISGVQNLKNMTGERREKLRNLNECSCSKREAWPPPSSSVVLYTTCTVVVQCWWLRQLRKALLPPSTQPLREAGAAAHG